MLSNHWETLTLESSHSKQIDEFIKKYRGCFVFLQKDEQAPKKLCLFSDYDSDAKFLLLKDEDETTFKIKYETKAIISTSFPNTGLVNHNNSFYKVSRIPQRQYRKAPHRDNCSVYSPLSRWIEENGYGLNFKSLYAAYFPEYADWNYAGDAIANGDAYGVALTNKVALSAHPGGRDKFLLWFDIYPVAEVSDKIYVKVEVLRQELSDFVKRNNIAMEIV